jgi:uncharacterized damage-inducible protein DinB
MSMKNNFKLMSLYNQSMNKSMYKVASGLSAENLEKNRDVFFDSIVGTLNHILVGDIIWLKRFASHDTIFTSLDYVRDIDTPASLDVILHPKLHLLLEERAKLDEVIVQFTSELTDQAIASPLAYSNTKGQLFVKNVGFLLQHFFNHQTHHRGQVSALLSQVGADVGVTDLLMSIPDE